MNGRLDTVDAEEFSLDTDAEESRLDRDRLGLGLLLLLGVRRELLRAV